MGNDDAIRLSKAVRAKLRQHEILSAEAQRIREKDKILIRSLFRNFYNKRLDVGIGFQSAYGSILSGDYFDLITLPDGNYLFVFADISGHGLPAYTTLVRLRSAIAISIEEAKKSFDLTRNMDEDFLVRDIGAKFTDIMDESDSHDFASVLFTFIHRDEDRYLLRFYNRSMLFPIIIRKFQGQVVDVYNLNRNEKGWNPIKGNLLSGDVRQLLEDRYLDTPACEFVMYEGDSILYFSDGIMEAVGNDFPGQEFGEDRIIRILLDNHNLMPQLIVHELLNAVYGFMGKPENQRDDMTAVLIDFPAVRY